MSQEVFIGSGAPGDGPNDPGTEIVIVAEEAEEAWRVALERFPRTAALEAWTLGEPSSRRFIRWMDQGEAQDA